MWGFFALLVANYRRFSPWYMEIWSQCTIMLLLIQTNIIEVRFDKNIISLVDWPLPYPPYLSPIEHGWAKRKHRI